MEKTRFALRRNVATSSACFTEVCLPTAGCPCAAQLRKGYSDGADIAHELLPRVAEWGAVAATVHGRTRQQRCLSCSNAAVPDADDNRTMKIPVLRAASWFCSHVCPPDAIAHVVISCARGVQCRMLTVLTATQRPLGIGSRTRIIIFAVE